MPEAVLALPAALCLVAGLCGAAGNAGDVFRQCLVSQPAAGLGRCLGTGAISRLQSWDDDAEFDFVDGLSLRRDGQEYREAFNFAERDPTDLRSIVDSVDHVFSQRSMLWDMGFLYPGLGLRMAPSITPSPILEFTVDPQREALNAHSLKEASTARIMARQFLVPLLLGFKFKAVSLIPILFGVLALLAKKAVVISKLALIASSAFGLATLLFNSQGSYGQPAHYQSTQHFNPGFGGHYRHPDEYQEVLYRGISDNLPESNDQLRLVGNLQAAYDRSTIRDPPDAKGRNFAWSEDEKVTKQTTS